MPDSRTTPDQVSFAAYEQHLISGGELLRQSRVEAARLEFLAALELVPDDPKALGLLGLACFRLAAFRDALPVYEKLVRLAPQDPSFHLNLGLVHLKLGNAAQAIEELKQSRELDPSQGRAVSYLGLAYARSGDYANAYKAFVQAGQSDLAKEMEQYLTEEQLAEIAVPVTAPEAGSAAYDAVEVVPGSAEGTAAGGAADEAAAEEVAATAEATEEAADEEQGEEGEVLELRKDQVIEPLADEDIEVVSAAGPVPSLMRSAVSEAVEIAAPASAAVTAGAGASPGHRPPRALSEFATARLIRPEDGDSPFEIVSGGMLVVRVRGRIMSRTEGVVVSGGELAYEPATRKSRGAATEEPFGADGRPLFFVTGQGHLLASPLGEHFAAVILEDDILYLREDLVFAFEDRLRWENGHVPGSAAAIDMVQFRGEGCVALRAPLPLLSVKLAPERVLYVDADSLAGWIGRVVPRLVTPAAGGKMSAPFVECTGEGVVLLEEEPAGSDTSDQ